MSSDRFLVPAGPPLRWWLLVWLVPTGLFIGLALVMEYSPIDRLLIKPFFDNQSASFPLRRHWFFDSFLHNMGKWLVLLSAIGAAMAGIAGWFVVRLHPWRWVLIYVALCAGLTSGLVAVLKAMTNRFPPWSIADFGGKVPYTPLFEGTPAPFTGGRGFPAGHASGIIAWVSLWFVARSMRATRPTWWLFPVLAGGVLFGWTQHVRGAHFPSHNLWTLAVAWSVAVAVAATFARAGIMPQPVTVDVVQRKESSMAISIRSWLVGVGGMFLGSILFATDTAVELLDWGPKQLHFWIECVEFTLIGPGLGVTCLLLAERLRSLREQQEIQKRVERERRLLVLGRMAAAVAHEVRNPLHTLRLVMDELRVEQPALQDHALRVHIDDSLERIDRAVDLVYRLARPDAEDDGAGDLVACLREAQRAMLTRINNRFIDLLDLPDNAAVRCSASGLRIIIDNLLRNAVEATEVGGSIHARIIADANEWCLRISNPGSLGGKGSPTQEAMVSGSGKSGGLGLGLAITRHLAESVGGTITLSAASGVVTAELKLSVWKDIV